MYTLFISTFDKLVTIGLLKDELELDKIEVISSLNHSEIIMPSIKEILDKNNINTNNLNEIIVVNGPGSFTGVRLGVTIGKTLAYVLNIPIKTITSLELFAVSSNKDTNKLVVISDLKGKYIGYFDSNNNKIEEFKYLNNMSYEEYLKTHKEYLIKDNIIDLNKVYIYLKKQEPTLCHIVNPIYVKGIEALNDK